MSFLAVLLPALAILVALLQIVEVRKYRTGRHLISGRRLALRVIAGALLILLLASVFVGVFILKLLDATAQPRVFLVYWGSCMAAAFGLMLVMLADVREVENRSRTRQHEMWREFARFIAGQIRGKEDQGESPPLGSARGDPESAEGPPGDESEQ
jgi:hypothetical protein